MLYPSNIPYMKTVRKKVLLDRGTPPRKGNLVFLFTESTNQSFDLMTQTTNLYSNGFMRFYFYPPRYNTRIGRFRLKLNHVQYRNDLIKELDTVPGVRPYPKGNMLITSAEQYSTYYDLATYVRFFNTRTEKLSIFKKIDLFWKLFTPIFEDSYGRLNHKVVLINAAYFPLNAAGPISERKQNPLYLFYMTLYKRFQLVKDLDIDFLIFSGDRVLKLNFSKCDEKSYITYLIQLRRVYVNAAIPEVNDKELHADEVESVPDETEDNLEEDKREPITTYKRTAEANSATGQSTQSETKNGAVVASPQDPASKVIFNIANIEEKETSDALLKKVKKLAKGATSNDSLEDISFGKSTKKSGNDEDSEDDEESDSSKAKEPDEEIIDDIEADLEVSDAEATKIGDELQTDTRTVAEIYAALTTGTTPAKSQRSSARDELLRKEQGKIQVKNTTLDDLAKINPKERTVPTTDVSKATYSANPNTKEVKFNNFTKAYVDEVMTKDIVGVFENLNDKSTKMFIRNIEVADSSTVTDLKETWTIYLEDENRNRHTIKVDIPKFYDKNFLWLGGNTKIIKNQLFYLPLVKIAEDTVMIVSNYNKMTITRIGGRALINETLMTKLVNKNEDIAKFFKKGSATGDNSKYLTTLEYDDYAKSYLQFKSGKTTIYFNQREATEVASASGIEVPEKEIFVGFVGDEPILLGMDSQVTKDRKTITDIILDSFTAEQRKKFRSAQSNVPKRVTYTAVTTMKQEIPMSVLICIWEGISSLLEKGEVKYRLQDGKSLRGTDLAPNEDYIRFNDCILIYERDVPTEMLMSGLKAINTDKWNIFDMNTAAPYIPYIEKKYGKISVLNALNNVYEFTIGPIEKEILTDMKLPTDLVSLMCYANKLLADRQCISELDMSEYRLRSAEIIPAILYDCIAKAYVPYKNSNGKKKLSIPQDAVIKKLLALETVEDFSSLNPFLELESTHGASTKGWRGVNLDHSYTIPKRCYDDSMRGVIGLSSSPDAQVGVNRTLSMEPRVNSIRGYIETTDNLDELKDVNLFSPAELLIPLGVTRDDPIRTGHSVKQSRASVPVKNASPVLMSNGSDEMAKYYLSSAYCVVADQDGFVKEYDEKAKMMVVEYKDGSHRAINLDKNIVKNGGGGFELSNILVTDLKVGDKFKANEALAWHSNFFKKIPGQGVRMCVGALAKVALYSLYDTYEDGTFITESLCDKCETEMVFRIKCVIGKNSNVFNMVKVGDEVSVGQPLIEFDESFEEADINSLLAALGDDEELKEAITSNNKNAKKSDKSGVIEEIKVYSAAELDELSPSLQKIVGDYYKKIERKTTLLNKYDKSDGIVKCGVMITESSGTTQPNRYGVIRGEKVNDGVLIEFYLKHAEPLEIGSKIANFTPLKNVIGEVIPAGYEPRSEFRKDEIVETCISPSSILARMVGSVYPTIFGNKVIIELKRSLREIYVGAGEYAAKRKKMLKLIYGVFDVLDPTGSNTKKYKDLFEPMSETAWNKFFKEFFENEYHYLILEMVDYEVNVTVEQIEKAADVLGIPLYEYVTFPHVNMDKDNPIVTPHPVPVGYLHIKRPQQTVMKKNGMSTGTARRAGITNQVTGEDKNGRESDLENCMLVSLGMKATLKELNGPRADDSIAEKEMLQKISTKGYFQLDELTDDVANKATLNAVDTYFLGMGLKTDLITKGLKLPINIENE